MKIAIIRDDGIGDLIVSSPIIDNINKYFPLCEINIYCSNRNIEYCQLLKENKIINDYFLIPKKLNLYNKIALCLKIRKVGYDNILVLSPKNINYLYSKISGAITSGVTLINTSKNGKDRYRPAKFLTNFLLNFNEVIDCRNDYLNSKCIHYADHYIKIQSPTTTYIKPKIRSHIPTMLNENNVSDYIIFHLDEKWDRTNWDSIDLISLLIKIDQNTKNDIIITEGIIKTVFNKSINTFNFKKINNSSIISQSNKYKKLFLIKDINSNDLFSLISCSKLVIQKHGGLTHMASSFNIPVIDIIYPNTENFLNKWKPRSNRYVQIINNNFSDTSKSIIKFLTDY